MTPCPFNLGTADLRVAYIPSLKGSRVPDYVGLGGNLQRWLGSPFPTAEGIFMTTPARGSPLTPSASRPRAGQCGNGEKQEARTSKTASAFVSQGTLVAGAERLHPIPS